MDVKENFITVEGQEELKKRRKYLLEVEIPENDEALSNARGMGDLSENADYHAARDRQGKLQAELNDIEYKLNNYRVIEGTKSAKNVGISSIVSIKEVASGETYTVKIVSSSETDIFSDVNLMKISNESPLGEALMGAKVGSVVTVKTGKPFDVEVLEIKIG